MIPIEGRSSRAEANLRATSSTIASSLDRVCAQLFPSPASIELPVDAHERDSVISVSAGCRTWPRRGKRCQPALVVLVVTEADQCFVLASIVPRQPLPRHLSLHTFGQDRFLVLDGIRARSRVDVSISSDFREAARRHLLAVSHHDDRSCAPHGADGISHTDLRRFSVEDHDVEHSRCRWEEPRDGFGAHQYARCDLGD